jgi:hypothetical protein
LAVIFLTCISCSKENSWFPNATVHGKCINYYTRLPLENIEIDLWGGIAHPSSHDTPKPKNYRTVFTDTDGYYEIKFSRGSKDYWVIPKSGTYTWVNNNSYDLDLIYKGDNTYDFEMK